MTTLIVAASLSIAAALYFMYWRSHALRFEQSGYTPPASSWFGEFGMRFFAWLLTFVTVGRVKILNAEKVPADSRAVFISNHQFPCDFAMLRRGAGRHFRMLTDSNELKGSFGVFAAMGGVISVGFKKKEDGARAEEACVKTVASKHFRVGSGLAALVWGTAIGVLIGWATGASFSWLVPVIASIAGLSVFFFCPGSEPALGIFPQGGLLPDDLELKENFRPGAVRIARAAAKNSGEPVMIVPMGIHYRRDPERADWTHRFLSNFRTMFLATRNPKYWNPLFRKDISGLPEAERAVVEAQRKEILDYHRKTRATIYGGVIVVGDPIDVSSLPEDPIEASNQLRDRVAELLSEARKH